MSRKRICAMVCVVLLIAASPWGCGGASEQDNRPTEEQQAAEQDNRPTEEQQAAEQDNRPTEEQQASEQDNRPTEGQQAAEQDNRPTEEQQAAARDYGVPVEITNSITMNLVLIPAGKFTGPPQEVAAVFTQYREPIAEYFTDEHPRNRDRITEPFYMGVHEVTVGQFRQFVKATGYKTDAEQGTGFKGTFGWNPHLERFELNEKYSWQNVGFRQMDDHPVVNVSWNDAVEFCKWLSRKEGRTYRLPTEAEWEYACRAGTATRSRHGEDSEGLAGVADAAAKAKFPDWKDAIKAKYGYILIAPVGSFEANPFGLYDMHGNVWEWCADWYGEEYCASLAADGLAGPSRGCGRVFRGGSWYFRPIVVRSAGRYEFTPVGRYYVHGFRVARTL